MAKYYYNGVLLPENPADKYTDYPKQIIVKWSNGNIQLIGSKNGLYFNGSTAVYDKNNATLLAYYLNGDTWVEDTNQSGKYSGWTIISNGASVLQWSNHDILNGSATATAIYFYSTYPIPEADECYYNGVRLPVIPVDSIGEAPYYWIATHQDGSIKCRCF